ncbi:MAG: ATP-binding protein [Nitrospinae bacterium]|nr:ATP-binding protein [Nitrospinota bacterium]
MLGKNVIEIIKCQCHPYELQTIKNCPVLSKILIAGDYYRTEEISFAGKDGAVFPAQCICNSIKEEGEIESIIMAFQDITEHKRMDEQIKTSLKEKEMLLKEIHHRVKNNLQIISSLFNLQSAYLRNNRQVIDALSNSRDRLNVMSIIIDILSDSQNRIRSIAIVHEKLYKSEDLSRINFAEYIKDLTDNLFRSYRVNSDAIALTIKAEDIYFDVDTAISLGLIINELVLNSIKYGFTDRRNGEIMISLQHENGRYVLTVRDNGVGFPEGVDFRNTESLGLQLVNTLTEQLNGKIEIERKNGTEFRITFEKKI